MQKEMVYFVAIPNWCQTHTGMNLKRADCCRPKYRRFARRTFSVNRRRHRHLRHRGSPLLRCPRFPSRRTCRNCPKTSCRRRWTRTRDSSAVATGAGTVAPCTLKPGTAVRHPVHQEVANHRRPADRYYECRHSARHGAPGFGRRPGFVPRNGPTYTVRRQMRRARSLII